MLDALGRFRKELADRQPLAEMGHGLNMRRTLDSPVAGAPPIAHGLLVLTGLGFQRDN